MARRNESERDFPLKAAIRAILWAQGYSTRLDVLLAYDKDIKGKNGLEKAGLTDLDVLGIRLEPGFRIHTVVADCKTVSGRVPERLFWLAGVGKFFGSDTNLLVRSQSIPDHALPLARSLDIALVGPDDLSILTNTYVNPSGTVLSQVWQDFFSPDLLGEALSRLSRLPITLANVERYRETRYWMDEPYRRLNQVLVALQSMAKEGSAGPIFQLVFADFVWLYVLALWEVCETLNISGLSKLEQGLELYVSGNEAGMRNLQRMKQSFETLARSQVHGDVSVSLLPPYFRNLVEVVARCIRRPNAVIKMARRAEWLIIGQIVGNLGTPPWKLTDDDLICSKLLGDIAKFMVQTSGLKNSFLDFYLDLLQDWETEETSSNVLSADLDASSNSQGQEQDAKTPNVELGQLGLGHLDDDNSTDENM
jgi:hypothetical protein